MRTFREEKVLPSGIVIEKFFHSGQTYICYIKGTFIIHNEGEPARTTKNNTYYYHNDLLHRLDGPADNYYNLYYIFGTNYSEIAYWNHPEVLKYKYLQEHPELQAFI